MAHSCSSRMNTVEAEGMGVQGQFGKTREFAGRLEHMRLCLKNKDNFLLLTSYFFMATLFHKKERHLLAFYCCNNQPETNHFTKKRIILVSQLFIHGYLALLLWTRNREMHYGENMWHVLEEPVHLLAGRKQRESRKGLGSHSTLRACYLMTNFLPWGSSSWGFYHLPVV